MKQLCYIALILILGLLQPLTVQAANPPKDDVTAPTLRVGLLTKQSSVILSADSAFFIFDAKNGEMVYQAAAKEKVTVTAGDQLKLNGKSLTAANLRIVVKQADTGYVLVNNRHYRGDIQIAQMKAGLTVINTLSIEEYLYGVIAKEISPEWPQEAVKAQAVAARSYAINGRHKHEKDGFDVCTTTDCQVYGGVDAENFKSNRAVDETHGQVLSYKGSVIPGYFHSSGGGYTENSENVWGTPYPYLRGVVDYDQNAPGYQWEKEFTAKELAALLQNAGYQIGRLTAVQLSPLTSQPILQSSDRGVSGRVKSMTFIGTQGSIELSGMKVRSLLDLKSTLFDVDLLAPAQKKLNFTITDSYGDHQEKEVTVNLPPVKEKSFLMDRSNLHHFSADTNERFVVKGFGAGHGIGLSQWGAKGMAEKVPANRQKDYYKEILQHYYQGVVLETLY